VRVWRPLVKKSTANQRKEHNAESTFSGLSLMIRVYLLSFSFCCLQNLRNPAKFSENLNLYSSRSSKVIDLGVNRKHTRKFLLVINSKFDRISYSIWDTEAFSFKIACFLSFSFCCLQNLWNPAKLSENMNLYSSRSSKVIDRGVNRKQTCKFLLVINSKFDRISCSFWDTEAFSFKIACFLHPPLFDTN